MPLPDRTGSSIRQWTSIGLFTWLQRWLWLPSPRILESGSQLAQVDLSAVATVVRQNGPGGHVKKM